MYQGVDVWISDCLRRAASDPCASRCGARLGQGLASRAALSDPYGQQHGLCDAWRPSCPIGRRRRMTGWRSSFDQRPDAWRPLLLMAIMLVLGALMSRREPAAKLLMMALAWVAIFGGGLRPVHVPRRSRLGRAAAARRGDRRRRSTQGERNPHPDGDRRPFLGRGDDQRRAGQVPCRQRRDHDHDRPRRPRARRRGGQPDADQMVRTGNGVIRVSTRPRRRAGGRRDRARRHAVHVAENEDLNVLGMNFLSSLERWGVEGRWLILSRRDRLSISTLHNAYYHTFEIERREPPERAPS